MRAWLRMLLLGFLIAPASALLGAADTDPPDEAAPRGHSVRGQGFYVWDEDARLASVWAAELSELAPVEGANLYAVLRALPPLEQTWLVSSWATSESEPLRRMLASALAEPLDGVGARWALEHLQRDPSAEVRRCARAAASGTDRALDL